MDAAQMNMMTAGQTYISIHSTAFPDREIRSQIQ